MKGKLYQIMADNRPNFEDEVYLQLSASSVLNSHPVGDKLLRDRISNLVGAFLGALKEGPDVFVSYAESIAEERIDEGIVLHELQLALQVLEEKAWQYIVEAIDEKAQVHCLGRVTLIIGTAKDRIADIYLHHLKSAESAMELLRRQRGHDSPVIAEDDLNWQQGHPAPHGQWT